MTEPKVIFYPTKRIIVFRQVVNHKLIHTDITLIYYFFQVGFVLHYLNFAICTLWVITDLDFRVKVKSFRTMLPVCYPVCTLVEASTVLWISVKPCGFPFAKVLVLWNEIFRNNIFNKSTTIFHVVHHRNDVIKCSKLK